MGWYHCYNLPIECIKANINRAVSKPVSRILIIANGGWLVPFDLSCRLPTDAGIHTHTQRERKRKREKKERDKQRQTERDRQRETERERKKKERKTEKERQRERETERDRERKRDRETDRERQRKKERQRFGENTTTWIFSAPYIKPKLVTILQRAPIRVLILFPVEIGMEDVRAVLENVGRLVGECSATQRQTQPLPVCNAIAGAVEQCRGRNGCCPSAARRRAQCQRQHQPPHRHRSRSSYSSIRLMFRRTAALELEKDSFWPSIRRCGSNICTKAFRVQCMSSVWPTSLSLYLSLCHIHSAHYNKSEGKIETVHNTDISATSLSPNYPPVPHH